MLKYRVVFVACMSLVAQLTVGEHARAVDHVAALAPTVSSDTFVVAYVSLAALPKVNDVANSKLFNMLPYGREGAEQELVMGLKVVEQGIEQIRAAGVDAVYASIGLGDLNRDGGPIVVLHVSAAGTPEKVVQTLSPLAAAASLGVGPIELRPQGRDLVLVGRKATLDRYASLGKSERADIVTPLTRQLEAGAVAAAVFCPGTDFRRVVREMWPALPGALAPMRGELADRWLDLEAAVDSAPDAKPRLVLQTSDAESAALFAKLWNDLPAATTAFGGNAKAQEMVKGYAETLVGALPVKVEGNRVTIGLPTDEAQIVKLYTMIGEAADKSMETSRRRERMNQFKAITIAMLNYESANKHLPPAAICDKDGKPLLSWRVAVLPYLEENALYKQFHLDEPWDSAHNLALVAKMPKDYADPDRKLKQLAAEGKTTFQVPAGADTAFHENLGTPFKDIKDGTSKTILVVEVEPSHAVIWTKPDDWNVDMQSPRTGVARADRDFFTAGFADAHGEIITLDKISDSSLRALFTRAGKDSAVPASQ